MKISTLVTTAVAAVALAVAGTYALSQDGADPNGMARWMETTKSTAKHKKLGAMIGKWNTTTRIWMQGKDNPPMESTGTAECSWLYDGKWLQWSTDGNMMGMPVKSLGIYGYDNFKRKYVFTQVDSFQTTMLRYEGTFGKDGKVLQMWGRMDEPMTNEHDKAVKWVVRFKSKDEIVFEVHDLPIGETDTKVVEFVAKRRQE